jgi:predicted RecB family endonuclease
MVRTETDLVDIVAEKDGRRLYAEVKGASSAQGLDVDTAIGQLVRRMPSEAD